MSLIEGVHTRLECDVRCVMMGPKARGFRTIYRAGALGPPTKLT